MLIAFPIIFMVSSYLVHFVKTNMHLLPDRNPSSISSFCSFYHAILLVMSVYYMGVEFGGALFICHCFKLTYDMVSWVLDIPILILRIKNQSREPTRLIESIFNLSFPMAIIAVLFTIISFYLNKFRSMLVFLQNNTSILIYAGVVVAALSIARIFVNRKINKN